jgi:GH24 family phage-related lysozyme (muramidase)
MKVSSEALRMIKHHEGVRLKPYKRLHRTVDSGRGSFDWGWQNSSHRME